MKKMVKKVCVFVMVMCLIVSSFSTTLLAQENDNVQKTEQSNTFSGEGEGTKLDPYQITNADQLKEITEDMSAYYVLANNIDLSDIPSWEPIGTEENQFTGELDGQGYTIDYMTIEDDGLQDIGLFGYCGRYAKIRNVNLANVNIDIDRAGQDDKYTSGDRKPCVGTIAGTVTKSGDYLNIFNCTSSGNVAVINCRDIYVGGIIGSGGNISNCINSNNVYVLSNKGDRYEQDGTVQVGGIVGFPGAIWGKVDSCVNYGNVNVISGDYAFCGGICGYEGDIIECKNYGNISAETMSHWTGPSYARNCNVGGITGTDRAEVSYSVNYGNVYSYAHKEASSCAGGIMGYRGGDVEYSVNVGRSITSIEQKEDEENEDVYRDVDGECGRIVAEPDGSNVEGITECYSVDSTLCNDKVPNEKIGNNNINGESIGEEEIDNLISNLYADEKNVISTSPSIGEMNVDSNLYKTEKDITVVFDGEVTANSGSIYIKNLDTGENELSYSLKNSSGISISGNTLTISNVKLPEDAKIAIVFDYECINVGGKAFLGFSSEKDWVFEIKKEEEDPITTEEQEYIDTHVDFVNSNIYQERMTSCWAKIIRDGLDTTTGNIGEALDKIFNSVNEIMKADFSEYFDNPYEPILAELINNQKETKLYDFQLKFQKERDKIISELTDICKAMDGNWTPQDSTALENLIKYPTYKEENPTFYKKCEELFAGIYDAGKVDKFLDAYGKANEITGALDKFGSVINMVMECMNYNALVASYIDTSAEFKASLMAAEYYMAANINDDNFATRFYYANAYEDLIDEYMTYLSDDCISDLIYNTYFVEGIKTVDEVFGSVVVEHTINYLAEACGVSSAVISKIMAVIMAYQTGWAIQDLLTNNGEIMDCRELARASYYLEDAMTEVVKSSAATLKKNKTYQSAKNFDASYCILQDLECYSLQNYGKYLSLQQESFIRSLLHGLSHSFNASEIENVNLLTAQWKSAKCHDTLENSTISAVMICCPIDVNVCDKEGRMVLSIVNNEIVKVADYCSASVSGDIKILAIPDINDYTIQIQATDNGKMDYLVSTFDVNTKKLLHADNYMDINLVKGHKFFAEYDNKTILKDDNNEVISVTNTIQNEESIIKVSSIQLRKEYTLKKGENVVLDSVIVPQNATRPVLSWTSSDERVAKIDEEGRVVALEEGETVIQAMAIDGSQVKAICNLTVVDESKDEQHEEQPSMPEDNTSYPSNNTSGSIKKPVQSQDNDGNNVPPAGTMLTDNRTNAVYMVTEPGVSVAYAQNLNMRATAVTVPSAVTIGNVTYKVTSIGNNAFKNNKKLKKVTIVGSVTSIGNAAFRNCTKLKKVTIPTQVKKIGKKAFYNCKNLRSLIVKAKKLTAKTVGNKAFTKAGSKDYRKLKVKVPSKKYGSYSKIFRKKGLSSKAKIIR